MERAELKALVMQAAETQVHDGLVFLCDPQWGDGERRALALPKVKDVPGSTDGHKGWLCIPTGGTSGSVRFARHDEKTLSAAVQGFCQFFNLTRVNAVDVLPSFHVSGLMARVRCAATGGKHVPCEWRRVEAGERPMLDVRADGWVISLVPTQLQRLMASPGGTEWLGGFRYIFVGGGPSWPELKQQAADAGLPIALTYGMTETAAMMAAISPSEFRSGERQWATPLPHVELAITADGSIRVEGESVFRGYFPDLSKSRSFETDDLGQIDERGRVQIFGRKDAVIITGGKKVQPVEVEAALQATGQFADVAVLGVRDTEWGEVVVACFPKGESAEPDWTLVDQGLERSLASYKRPKRYVAVVGWPRNAQGKLSRAELAQRIGLAPSGREAPRSAPGPDA
ncbi:MAG: AMP-binding protein [Opitutus sp.]